MSSSNSPPPPNPLNSDSDYEIEYEEIEEEIEVEEEAETDEEEVEQEQVKQDGDSSIGQDLTPVRQENHENDMDGVDYETEYEEIEVEEEVEVEEEIEEEVEKEEVEEDGDSLIGEDLTPLRQENHENDMDGGNYANEYEEIEEEIKAEEKIEEEVEKKEVEEDGDSLMGEDLTPVRQEKHENGETSSHNDTKDLLDDCGEVDIKQVSPRLHIPQIRLRSSSSSAEFDGENKRLKIVCAFHAKGWCIKGNSCRFLHIKEGLDAVVKKSEVEREASSSTINGSQQRGENSRLDSGTGKLVLHEHDNRGKTNISAFGTPLEDMIKKSDTMSNVCWSGPYSHSRQLLSFGSSARNANVLRTHNILESSIEHRASISSSLQERTPAFSGYESEIRSRDHFLGDTEQANCKTKTFSNDWEPSVPFCPSHIITQNLLYKESLYDPARDDVGQPDVRDGQVNFSNSAHGSSHVNMDLQSNKPPEEDTHHFGSTGEDNTVDANYDNRLNYDKPRHKVELKIDGPVDETDVNSKKSGHVQNESKALKYFRAELVEFVKELLKPTWREGLLSREAHKTIVKKAVDKVLSTLESNQIPSSPESTKLYLSSSHSKLAMLVEGYIDIYGKF